MAASYATRSDVYRVGVPRGALTNPARTVASVDAATDRMVLDGHGLETDRQVQFVAAPNATLPAPLVESTVYFARFVSETTFEVAATASGAALALTPSDTDDFAVYADLGPEIDDEIEGHSRWVDATLQSQGAPFTAPYPRWVVALVAKRTAASLVRRLGLSGRQQILDEAEAATLDAIRMGKTGIPLRDGAATSPTMLAVPSSASSRSNTRTIP